jgi:hypothetical protein
MKKQFKLLVLAIAASVSVSYGQTGSANDSKAESDQKNCGNNICYSQTCPETPNTIVVYEPVYDYPCYPVIIREHYCKHPLLHGLFFAYHTFRVERRFIRLFE